MPSAVSGIRSGFVAIVLAAALTPPAAAAERSGAGPAGSEPLPAPRKSSITATARPKSTTPHTLRQRPASTPGKIEVFVDEGLDRPRAEPTERERAKLGAARAAVEAARAAGTLWAPARVSRTAATPAESEAAKLERLRAARPAPVTSSPEEMGLPADPRPRQKLAPAKLTPNERAKLATKPSVTPEPRQEESK